MTTRLTCADLPTLRVLAFFFDERMRLLKAKGGIRYGVVGAALCYAVRGLMARFVAALEEGREITPGDRVDATGTVTRL